MFNEDTDHGIKKYYKMFGEVTNLGNRNKKMINNLILKKCSDNS